MELKEQILQAMIKRAAELFKKDPSELGEETSLEALGAKSVNYVQILSVLEEEFDVECTYMEFRRKKTLGEAAEYFAEQLGG